MENGLKKQYGLLMAICMVVGTVVGSGVFFKAQAILQKTNGDMPMGILAWIIGGLVIVAAWLVYFYGANLTAKPWFGVFSFDSSELPSITIYALYIPMFIQFMRKEKGLSPVKRFVLPSLGIIGSAFMVIAEIYSHGYLPYITAKEAGAGFSCPVLFYLIVFAVIMGIGLAVMNPKKKAK